MTRWSDEDMARARELFCTSTLSLRSIALETGLPRATIQFRAREAGWVRCRDRGPKGGPVPDGRLPGHRKASLVSQVNAAARRHQLALRALAAAERQMADIEVRMARGSDDVVAEERSARVLSATIRTLRELAALESRAAEAAAALGRGERTDGPDAPPARSHDEIRQDFARRLRDLFGDGSPAALPG